MHLRLLIDAFKKILVRHPGRGTVVFVRCLSGEIARTLAKDRASYPKGWQVRCVADEHLPEIGVITADRAVEFREAKAEPLLLLVDVELAGAGMDGIYSAAREITETDLFREANRLALKKIGDGEKEKRKFAELSVKKARRTGRTISAWNEFDYYASSLTQSHPAESLCLLGLWPIDTAGGAVTEELLDDSMFLVRTLILMPLTTATPAARVESLQLRDCPDDRRRKLINFVRQAGSRTLDEVMKDLSSLRELWLNSIVLGRRGDVVERIEVVPWRTSGGSVARWTGLNAPSDSDAPPEWVISPSQPADSRIEVRWKVSPPSLPKGVAEFSVVLLVGDDEEKEELASRRTLFNGGDVQKVRFSGEDLGDQDENAVYDSVRVKISVVGTEIEGVSEEFLIRFGMLPERPKEGSGHKVRSLVEGLIQLNSREDVSSILGQRSNAQHFGEDASGFIYCKKRGTPLHCRVFRPPLLREVEESWAETPSSIPRWRVMVRADGTRVGFLEKVEMVCTDDDLSAKLGLASARFLEWTRQGPGILSVVHESVGGKETRAAEEYLLAWASALEQDDPVLALAHTVEIQDLTGKTLGLVVLPTHPLRVAWHYAFDALALQSRFEENLSPKEVQETILAPLDGSDFPAMLPGLDKGESFIFGDTLGFAAVAMLRDTDLEPKASMARIANAFNGGAGEAGPSIGRESASVLGGEISKYIEYHDLRAGFRIHALRAGDGLTVARALGFALEPPTQSDSVEKVDGRESRRDLSCILQLYPSKGRGVLAGHFLAETAEKRRCGAGYIEESDRWMLENFVVPGNITLPRLRWAKREEELPETAAHISVAFDAFETRIGQSEHENPTGKRPLQGYGLISHVERRYSSLPLPRWEKYLAQAVEGVRHPVSPALSDRMLRIHNALLRAVGKNLEPGATVWPVVRTTISKEQEESLRRLHHLSDWVITVGRHAGIEYFDSPNDAKEIYDAYVIDAVPEREDLGCLQLVTSTGNLDEVRGLLDATLADMGLSSSRRNAEFLLEKLKALSGRLAIRLACPAVRSSELIALAMVQANCAAGGKGQAWIPLQEGFWVPLDDIRELLPRVWENDTEEEAVRPDLLFVSLPQRGGFQFRFVEVKYRRHLRAARTADILEKMTKQTEGLAARWREWYFGTRLKPSQRVIRQSQLARMLRFYLEKALRHHLSVEVGCRKSSASTVQIFPGFWY